MARKIKFIILTVPFIFFSIYFGEVCRQASHAYTFIFSPSWAMVGLLLKFIIVSVMLTLGAGLVAVFLRPPQLGTYVFLASGISMLPRWGISKESVILVLLYILCGIVFFLGVIRELESRVKFSARGLTKNHGMLLMVLVIMICGSFYFGYVDSVERRGSSVPGESMKFVVENLQQFIVQQVPASKRPFIEARFDERFREQINKALFEELKPYELYIPLLFAAVLLIILAIVPPLISWMPTMLLKFVVSLLITLGIADFVTEMKETTKIVAD